MQTQWHRAAAAAAAVHQARVSIAGPPYIADPSLIRDELLHELFEAQVEAHPDHVAVECAGERVTYAELDRRANQLAHRLRNLGAGPQKRVGVLVPRSIDLYATILAILKTGAAYVPLDTEYPAERIAYILDDCKVHTLVTSGTVTHRHGTGTTAHVIHLDEAREELARRPACRLTREVTGATARDLCYVIYTSGSTGRPKGVEITHRSACHLVRAEGAIFKVTAADRVYQGFSVAFDASVEEIWLALFAGATLVAAAADVARGGSALATFLANARVSVMSCVPTLLAMMGEGGIDVPTLRLLILGGEACPAEIVRRWARPGRRRIVNTYGPTETTVIATYAELHPGRPVTIGRALSNYRVYILDEQLRPVAPGQSGELYIGGIGVARGYAGRADLTAERFVVDPFVDLKYQISDLRFEVPRLYRTGDLGQLAPSGEIEFLGRADSQVKLRGFRVELEEIEAALLECPGVSGGAAVTVRDDGCGVQQLAGYVVGSIDEAMVKAHLRTHLPAYMVPATIDELAALPVLFNGKLDRSALPLPKRRQARDRGDSPKTPREAKLMAAWETLFGGAAISRTDDFFLDLGGHSLLAATLVSRLRAEDRDFRDLSILDVYHHPTIAGLAAAMDERRSREEAPTPAPAGAARFSTLGYTLCCIAQLPCLYLVLGLYSLQWLAPYLVYSWMIADGHAVAASLLWSVGALVALPPAMLVINVAAKWLLIGRYKPGRHRLWGWFYLRWWLAERIASLAPTGFLAGTPVLPAYLRLLGARIGLEVYLGSDDIGAPDLVHIGDGASIGDDATLNNVSVEEGWLKIGRIDIGIRCFIGARAVVGLDTTIEDDGRLEDLSLLPAGGTIPAGENWAGSPAIVVRDCGVVPLESQAQILRHNAFLHALGVLLLPCTYLLALLPGMLAMVELGGRIGWQRSLLAAPLVAVSFIVLLCIEIVLLKWLLLGRVKPGRYPIRSGFYLRKWFVDQLMNLSLDVMGPLYATLYLAPWYRMLGAKLGKNAELSTACSASPDMLDIGDQSFIADYVCLGPARVDSGQIDIAPTRIGRRAFIGNSALIPASSQIGDSALIGVLSTTPRLAAVAQDTSWLGSPAIFLPERPVNEKFPEHATFRPTRKLYVQRYVIEFFRVTLPATMFVILTATMLHVVIHLRGVGLSIPGIVALFPLLYAGFGLFAAGFVIAAKWLLMGRYVPGERPLWSPFVWRTELLTALHENLADGFLVDMLCGTPWVCWFFRLLGARIGRRVFLDTTCLTEFDLIRIGDDAAINAASTLQTHLFEDRVMKMSTIDIGPRCTVGTASVVLYDSAMADDSRLGDLSLLMKGERLPPGTQWQGSPARVARTLM
jgi:non-ribosomal peptide synthetase-like protein